jgi:hypothetical protein
MQTLMVLHQGLSRAVIIYGLLLALWGLWRYVRGLGVDGSYLGSIVIGELLIVTQGLVGAAMMWQGLAPGRTIHLLYGMLAIISFPATFAFTHGETSRREMLIWGLISLFVFGLGIRATLVAN